jgi:hypothetical protein
MDFGNVFSATTSHGGRNDGEAPGKDHSEWGQQQGRCAGMDMAREGVESGLCYLRGTQGEIGRKENSGNTIHREERDKCFAKSSLRDQVTILKCHLKETKSALVSWDKQLKQMFFCPDRALEELIWQIKKHWGIPRRA